MPLIDHKQTPSPSMQRWFGLSLTALLLIVAYGLTHVTGALSYGVAGGGLLIGVVYYLLPASQLPIIRAWQLLTFPLAFVLSHLLLGTVFFCVVLPIGLVLRLLKYDPLRLRDPDANSAWVKKSRPTDVSRYFKQF